MASGAVAVGAPRGLRNPPFQPLLRSQVMLLRCARRLRPGTGKLVRAGRSGAGEHAACSQNQHRQQDPEMGERGLHILTLANERRPLIDADQSRNDWKTLLLHERAN